MTLEVKKNVKGSKQVKFIGLKVAPSKPDDAQLAKINQFTRRPFTADELYIGQLRLANNCIDRDNERFSEEVLQRFAATAIRKTMLFDHNRQAQESAIGKFFDVTVEKMALQQATAETGEELMLPDGVTEVWFLSPWFYIPVKGVSEEVIVKIDAGIYDFASIGFRAESLVPIMDGEGDIRFWEYRGTGKRTEMTEGSLVYLGAQYGMSMKSDEEKGAVSFSPTTMADEGAAWDAAGAKKRIAKWASSDGSGDADKIDWAKYRKAFAWYDSGNAEIFGSYKLPHHDIINGEICVVWAGCSAAMAACMGGRGGVNIPEDELDAVKSHLAKHYKQFGKEVPKAASETGEGGSEMEWKKLIALFKKLFKGKAFSEDTFEEDVKIALDEHVAAERKAAVDEAVKPLNEKVKALDTEIAGLKPLAEEGKAYRKSLVEEYATLKTKIGDVDEKPETREKTIKTAEGFGIDFLKAELVVLGKRVEEKFPDNGELNDTDDLSKKRAPGGSKTDDYLIPDEEKK